MAISVRVLAFLPLEVVLAATLLLAVLLLVVLLLLAAVTLDCVDVVLTLLVAFTAEEEVELAAVLELPTELVAVLPPQAARMLTVLTPATPTKPRRNARRATGCSSKYKRITNSFFHLPE
ncbi:MAG: hypothetical protein M1396_06555 [Chloroflexi bacterium]|nr:hypothetical protein [Chloroflexota bacterium]